MSRDLAGLSLDLFLLGHAHLTGDRAGDGYAFERRVRAYLNAAAMPHASEFRVFGRRTLSGLHHQLDEQTRCPDALVIGGRRAGAGLVLLAATAKSSGTKPLRANALA